MISLLLLLRKTHSVMDSGLTLRLEKRVVCNSEMGPAKNALFFRTRYVNLPENCYDIGLVAKF